MNQRDLRCVKYDVQNCGGLVCQCIRYMSITFIYISWKPPDYTPAPIGVLVNQANKITSYISIIYHRIEPDLPPWFPKSLLMLSGHNIHRIWCGFNLHLRSTSLGVSETYISSSNVLR